MVPAAGWGNEKLTNGQTVSLSRDKEGLERCCPTVHIQAPLLNWVLFDHTYKEEI